MASYDVFEPLFTNQFIGGEWTASSSPNRIAVENPATLEKFAEIPDGTVEDIDRAVDAASLAGNTARKAPGTDAAVSRTLQSHASGDH